MTSDLHKGVWLSDMPVDCNEGAAGEDLLAVEILEEVIAMYESRDWHQVSPASR